MRVSKTWLGRKQKLLRGSNRKSQYVHAISHIRHRITFTNCKDDFDILKFLRGGLGELPPRPNPKIVDLGTKHIMCEVRRRWHWH